MKPVEKSKHGGRRAGSGKKRKQERHWEASLKRANFAKANFPEHFEKCTSQMNVARVKQGHKRTAFECRLAVHAFFSFWRDDCLMGESEAAKLAGSRLGLTSKFVQEAVADFKKGTIHSRSQSRTISENKKVGIVLLDIICLTIEGME
jgi:hypothetical protein